MGARFVYALFVFGFCAFQKRDRYLLPYSKEKCKEKIRNFCVAIGSRGLGSSPQCSPSQSCSDPSSKASTQYGNTRNPSVHYMDPCRCPCTCGELCGLAPTIGVNLALHQFPASRE